MKTGKDVDKCLDIATQTCRQVWASRTSTEHMLLLLKIKNSKTTTQIWCTTY